MPPQIAILDPELKPDHIDVGENRVQDRCHPESRPLAQLRTRRLPEGRTHQSVCQKAGHAPDCFIRSGDPGLLLKPRTLSLPKGRIPTDY